MTLSFEIKGKNLSKQGFSLLPCEHRGENAGIARETTYIFSCQRPGGEPSAGAATTLYPKNVTNCWQAAARVRAQRSKRDSLITRFMPKQGDLEKFFLSREKCFIAKTVPCIHNCVGMYKTLIAKTMPKNIKNCLLQYTSNNL